MGSRPRIEVVWRPQAGPQKALIDCPLPEILYGGARGGGKTDGVLGKYALKAEKYGQHFNAVFFRKEMPQQDDLIERAKAIYLPIGASWQEQAKRFTFKGGGRVRFRPLESVVDAEKYQGQNLTDAAVEEAGNYPSPQPIDMLFGALRSVGGVPIQLILTANPGGPGHNWIKARYVDRDPLGMRILERVFPSGGKHQYCYIPSRVGNNKILLANDPGYIDRLHLVGSPELVRAWLLGDWNVIAGAFFPEFALERHVIQPFRLPANWPRFRAMDWGSAAPFSVGWYAVADGMTDHPRGCLIKYREWYGAKKDEMGNTQPNIGLKLEAGEVGRGIVAREVKDECEYGVVDPSAYKIDGGPSIAERMSDNGAWFRKADNTRLSGWDQLRGRLKGDGDGRPMLLLFNICVDTIRTIPALQHDKLHAEDVDTDGEDHAADETRYACMSRPWARPIPKAPEIPRGVMVGHGLNTATLEELYAETARMRQRI